MKKKFCPKCGKTVEKIYDNLCKDCFLLRVSFAGKLPDKIIVRRCKSCEKIFVGKKTANTVENAIDLILSDLLKQPEIHAATYRVVGSKVYINLTLKVNDLQKTEEKISNLIIKNIFCQHCHMKSTGYYQSILQLRVPSNLLSIVLAEVENQIEAFNQYDNLAFISKIDKRPEWIDVYIGSKRVAKQISKYLKNKFKASIKISRKLSGYISGKKVYRDTILIEIGE
jgi:nonsense-mediated mRNA decay protein 3